MQFDRRRKAEGRYPVAGSGGLRFTNCGASVSYRARTPKPFSILQLTSSAVKGDRQNDETFCRGGVSKLPRPGLVEPPALAGMVAAARARPDTA